MLTEQLQCVRQMFQDDGVSVAEWARQRSFSLPLVYAVLSGRNRGTRGESYRIAVALGLRPGPQHHTFFDLRRQPFSSTAASEEVPM